MTAHELFPCLSPAESEGVLGWLHENDRAAYRSCVGILATRRKLRPVFVERKPRPERHAWMKEALGKAANNDLALEVLQAWTLGANGKMVCEFLDALGVTHDGKGLVDELPAQPPEAQLNAAVAGIVGKHPPDAVFVYLNLLVGTGMAEWPALTALLASDPLLCRSPQP